MTRGPSVKQTTSSHPLPTTALTLLFLGLAGLLWAAFDLVEMRRSPGFRTRRMLDTYTYSASTAALESVHSKSPIGRTVFSRALLALANRLVSNKERRDRLVVRLSRADVALRPGEWLVVQMLVTIVGFLFGAVLLHSLVAGLFLGAAGYGGSVAWLALKGRRRLRAFEEQLPNSLQMVAGSLRAGFSLSQSLDALVREGLQPIAGEVHRALSEVRLGSTVEDSLEHVADRMDSMEFRWVVMAIRIQHEVGGNLAEVLLNTSATMRERARLRRQVKALSAEGRLSAQILFGLPLVMALYMVTLRRAYIRPLYTEVMGLVMLSFGALLLLVGAWWMRKVVKVDA